MILVGFLLGFFKGPRAVWWMVLILILAVMVVGQQAPTTMNQSVDPTGFPAGACAYGEHVISAVQTESIGEYSQDYTVTCSDGVVTSIAK